MASSQSSHHDDVRSAVRGPDVSEISAVCGYLVAMIDFFALIGTQPGPALLYRTRFDIFLLVPEADDARDKIQQDHSWNAARLGASHCHEVGDRHGNKIRPCERARRRIRAAAAGGARYQTWIFLRDVVATLGPHRLVDRPTPSISFYY
jgi:hypothetical protein